MADESKSHISDEDLRNLFPIGEKFDAWARAVNTKADDNLPIEDELDYLYREVRHTQWMVGSLAASILVLWLGGRIRGRNSHA